VLQWVRRPQQPTTLVAGFVLFVPQKAFIRWQAPRVSKRFELEAQKVVGMKEGASAFASAGND
jgi:hypothetical protein